MSKRRLYGSVRRLPSGRWQARYWADGGERVTAPMTFATRADAHQWLSALETAIASGDWQDPRLGAVLFADWAISWLAKKTPKVRASTADLYSYLIRRYLIPRFGSTPVGKITVVGVQAWLADLHSTKLSANSVAKAYRLMKAVMADAVDAGLIPRSPCRIRGAGTETAPEIHIATPAQVAALATAVGPRWEALVFTAAYSGLRWGELAGLRRSDIDLVRQTITVSRKLAEVNGELSFGPPKSAAGRRTVGIPSFVARSLAAHLDLYGLPGDDGLVFASTDGEPMRRSNFRRRVWEPATRAVGMDGFTFHALRHTAATLGAASGASLKALMTRMGHSSARAALRYQHVIDGQDADIVRYLERFADTPYVAAGDRDAPQFVGTKCRRGGAAERAHHP